MYIKQIPIDTLTRMT